MRAVFQTSLFFPKHNAGFCIISVLKFSFGSTWKVKGCGFLCVGVYVILYNHTGFSCCVTDQHHVLLEAIQKDIISSIMCKMKALGHNNTSLSETLLLLHSHMVDLLFDGCFCPLGRPSDAAGSVVASVQSGAQVTVCAEFCVFSSCLCGFPPCSRVSSYLITYWIGYAKLCRCCLA